MLKLLLSAVALATMLGGASMAPAAESPEAGRALGVAYTKVSSPTTVADMEALAAFYEKTFDMQEIGRISDVEIILKYGATPAKAKANKAPGLIIDRRTKPDEKKILFVTYTKNIRAFVERAKANGATQMAETGVRPNGFLGGLIKDPAGNVVELLEEGSDTRALAAQAAKKPSVP